MEGFYPMPMFINLEVNDLEKSADWYLKVLGFRDVFRGPCMVHLRRERYQDLLLFQLAGNTSPGEGLVVQFQAGETSVDEIAVKARLAGASIVDGPLEQPWNAREITVLDPDGYRLRFSEVINPDLSFDEVMCTSTDT